MNATNWLALNARQCTYVTIYVLASMSTPRIDDPTVRGFADEDVIIGRCLGRGLFGNLNSARTPTEAVKE